MQVLEFALEEGDQIFSYWFDNRELIHFNASLLARVRKAVPSEFKLIELPLSDQIYDLCMKHRGIEEPKVERLRGKDLREPGYIALWNTDKPIPDYSVVDGHHRIVRRYRGGIRVMSFWACQEYLWRQTLVPDHFIHMERVMEELPPRPEKPTNIIHEVWRK